MTTTETNTEYAAEPPVRLEWARHAPEVYKAMVRLDSAGKWRRYLVQSHGWRTRAWMVNTRAISAGHSYGSLLPRQQRQ